MKKILLSILLAGFIVLGHASEHSNRFQSWCDNGDAGACAILADMYQYGDGVVKNISVANELYVKACNGGKTQFCNYTPPLQNTPIDNKTKSQKITEAQSRLSEAEVRLAEKQKQQDKDYVELEKMYIEGKILVAMQKEASSAFKDASNETKGLSTQGYSVMEASEKMGLNNLKNKSVEIIEKSNKHIALTKSLVEKIKLEDEEIKILEADIESVTVELEALQTDKNPEEIKAEHEQINAQIKADSDTLKKVWQAVLEEEKYANYKINKKAKKINEYYDPERYNNEGILDYYSTEICGLNSQFIMASDYRYETCIDIAIMYRDGIGKHSDGTQIKQDKKIATEYFRLACKGGKKEVCSYLEAEPELNTLNREMQSKSDDATLADKLYSSTEDQESQINALSSKLCRDRIVGSRDKYLKLHPQGTDFSQKCSDETYIFNYAAKRLILDYPALEMRSLRASDNFFVYQDEQVFPFIFKLVKILGKSSAIFTYAGENRSIDENWKLSNIPKNVKLKANTYYAGYAKSKSNKFDYIRLEDGSIKEPTEQERLDINDRISSYTLRSIRQAETYVMLEVKMEKNPPRAR